MNKLLLGFDIVTYNGEQPNCLDPKFLSTIHQSSDFDYRFSGEGFKKRWNQDWPIYNSGFWDNHSIKKSVYEIIKYHSNEKWFYMVEPFGNIESFFGNHSFYNKLILENISSVALNEIKNGNGNLLINYIVDGGLSMTTDNFKKIIEFTHSNNIPDEKVYLIFQDFNLIENIKSLGVNYNCINYNWAHHLKATEFWNTINIPNFSFWPEDTYEPQFGKMEKVKSSIASYTEFEQSIGKDKKDFLFLCRHWKKHRLHILDILYKLGLENNLVSWDNRFFDIGAVNYYLQDADNHEMIELIKTTSKHLDIEDITKIAGYGYEDKNLYLNSYLSIVAESVFFQPEPNFPTGYISEKIWKPIGHSQPFILAGPANSLKYIQSMGYKTFHPYIDESYDLELDDKKRMDMILLEIEKFINKTKQEKDDFLNNIKDIVKYNQEYFLQYPENNTPNNIKEIIWNLTKQTQI
jgi:hypothetical protein